VKIRFLEEVIELFIDARTTSSSWVTPNILANKLVYKHIGPRIDKLAETGIPLKLTLVIDKMERIIVSKEE